MAKRRLPEVFYNWISMTGALLAALTFAIIFFLLLIDLFVHQTTLYLGLLTYIVLPGFMIFGLLLIALGAWREHRRALRGQTSSFPRQLHIDFENPRHRNLILIVSIGTVVFLLASSVGSFKAYEATESTAFCGKMCHAVMEPEYTAYQTSPHAQVSCVECHIGPGADWFVRSKLTGLYQVYATLANKYPRPVPTPIKNLRPARDTCLECHWPEKFFGERKDVNPHFLADEQNTPYPITLLLKVGGGSHETGAGGGIHWHMQIENKIDYIARDEGRQDIGWVRSTRADGTVVEYHNSDAPMTAEERAAGEVRTVDCIDCHNRPSHNYRSPMETVNESMAAGRIDPGLPYVKRETVKALDSEYPDRATALAAIADKIEGFYRTEYPAVYAARRADVAAAVAETQKIYKQNFFPEMGVTWRVYPDHLGHTRFSGCFRCHGSTLVAETGETISGDCTSCHTILSQGNEPGGGFVAPEGLTFRHPVDIGGLEVDGNCTLCHAGGAELY